ncbi:NADH-quinone oxidoreductase subunit L, partial [Chloroflexota bacterium]
TYITFVIGSLSLAGIWPLAGFWSKDEIVAIALQQQPILGSLALITVFMTAFYMFRVVFMTFGGEYRGGSPEAHGHPHESPPVMVTPMVVLAILAVVSGFWNVTGDFGALMGHGETYSFAQGFFGILTHSLPWISLMLAGLGILLAYAIYSAKWLSAERIGSIFKPLYTLFLRKYWMDELYENVIVRIVLLRGLFSGLEKVDTYGIDGIVNGVANGAYAGGKAIRRVQTGQLQLYGLVMGTGILAIIIILYLFG